MVFALHSTLSVKDKKMELTLENKSDAYVLENFKLCFSIPHAIFNNLDGAKVLKSYASYAELMPTDKTIDKTIDEPVGIAIHPNRSWAFSFNTHVTNTVTDAPLNAFLMITQNNEEQCIPVETTAPKMIHYTETACVGDDFFDNIRANTTMQEVNEIVPIIPQPMEVEKSQGTLDAKRGLRLLQSGNQNAINTMGSETAIETTSTKGWHSFISLVNDLAIDLPLDTDDANANITIDLVHNTSDEQTFAKAFTKFDYADVEDESYALHISSKEISITAASSQGILYALISLLQLWIARDGVLPCISIIDKPRFIWRGFMLDTVRQYYDMNELKRIMRILALHKINVFHWHLTDDEAWRIELDAYPDIAKTWGYRGYEEALPPFFGSGYKKTGGTYNRQDIDEIVIYAKNLGINIMPEFDIPGHSYALLKALPELIEEEDKSHYHSVQGYYPNVINPGLETSYKVIETIITQMASQFPFAYFHYGCDEQAEGSWLSSDACKELMHTQNLADKNKLQNYFLLKIESLLARLHKKGAAWEEAILHEDVSKNSIIFSWKSVEAGRKACTRDYPVVICPGQYYYLDIAQSNDPYEIGASWAGSSNVYDTYAFEPVDLNSEKSENIIGIQANLWSESLYKKEHVDYMIFPRLAAIAETAWTPSEEKDISNFMKKIAFSYKKLMETMGYSHRIPVPK